MPSLHSSLHATLLSQENTKELREHIRSSNAVQENSVDVLLKHILRNFMRGLNIDPSCGEGAYRNARVSLSAEGVMTT